jgi:hypothetical protein
LDIWHFLRGDKNALEGDAAQYFDGSKHLWIVCFERVNFMLCEFHLNFKTVITTNKDSGKLNY